MNEQSLFASQKLTHTLATQNYRPPSGTIPWYEPAGTCRKPIHSAPCRAFSMLSSHFAVHRCFLRAKDTNRERMTTGMWWMYVVTSTEPLYPHYDHITPSLSLSPTLLHNSAWFLSLFFFHQNISAYSPLSFAPFQPEFLIIFNQQLTNTTTRGYGTCCRCCFHGNFNSWDFIKFWTGGGRLKWTHHRFTW